MSTRRLQRLTTLSRSRDAANSTISAAISAHSPGVVISDSGGGFGPVRMIQSKNVGHAASKAHGQRRGVRGFFMRSTVPASGWRVS